VAAPTQSEIRNGCDDRWSHRAPGVVDITVEPERGTEGARGTAGSEPGNRLPVRHTSISVSQGSAAREARLGAAEPARAR
jgi:hypothetical protein